MGSKGNVQSADAQQAMPADQCSSEALASLDCTVILPISLACEGYTSEFSKYINRVVAKAEADSSVFGGYFG